MKWLLALQLVFYSAAQQNGGMIVDFDHGTGSVSFLAIGHPKLLKVKGVGAAPKGKLVLDRNLVSGELTFDLNSFDTGIQLRNRHLREKYVETAKYPTARLKLEKLDISKKDDIPLEGTLDLHGVQKPIHGKASVSRDENSSKVKAEFPLKLEDFKITTPSFAGVTVGNEITVTVEATAPLVSAPDKTK